MKSVILLMYLSGSIEEPGVTSQPRSGFIWIICKAFAQPRADPGAPCMHLAARRFYVRGISYQEPTMHAQ